MSVKNLAIVVVAHQPYIRHLTAEGEFAGPENDKFFGAISQTYLPLINLLHKFEEEGINSKFSIVLTPVVCSMLADSVLQNQYVEWLDRCIELGTFEVSRLSGNPDLLKNAEISLEKAKQNKIDFTEKYECNLIKQFAEFEKKGMIEILASCGTYAFLPHYSDMPEIINAQVETGILSHKYFFGSAPEGLWLPYMGFSTGLERTLRSYGINYTILDSQALLFSSNAPETGIFAPVRCWNSLVLFGRDSESPADITGENGFSSNSIYKNQNKDIGFELNSEDLHNFIKADSARSNTLFRYWSKENGNETVYNYEKAIAQAKTDGIAYLASKNEKLNKAAEVLNGDPCLVCTLDAEMLGQTWAEGMDFFEAVLRNNTESEFVCPGSLIGEQFKLTKVQPYPSAASGSGYGEELLDSSNSWMIRYTRKMCERMVDLAGRFPDDTGLKARLLILGAKELLLAQSAELAKMLHDGEMPEVAEKNFTSSVIDFTTVFDSLGSNIVSTEWLTKLEKEHNLFPWMNYRIFSKKL